MANRRKSSATLSRPKRGAPPRRPSLPQMLARMSTRECARRAAHAGKLKHALVRLRAELHAIDSAADVAVVRVRDANGDRAALGIDDAPSIPPGFDPLPTIRAPSLLPDAVDQLLTLPTPVRQSNPRIRRASMPSLAQQPQEPIQLQMQKVEQTEHTYQEKKGNHGNQVQSLIETPLSPTDKVGVLVRELDAILGNSPELSLPNVRSRARSPSSASIYAPVAEQGLALAPTATPTTAPLVQTAQVSATRSRMSGSVARAAAAYVAASKHQSRGGALVDAKAMMTNHSQAQPQQPFGAPASATSFQRNSNSLTFDKWTNTATTSANSEHGFRSTRSHTPARPQIVQRTPLAQRNLRAPRSYRQSRGSCSSASASGNPNITGVPNTVVIGATELQSLRAGWGTPTTTNGVGADAGTAQGLSHITRGRGSTQ